MLLCRAADGVVVAANDAWLALTGFERDEVLGRTWPELAFTGEQEGEPVLGSASAVHEPHEVRLRTKAPGHRIAERRSSRIEIGGGAFDLITAADLTEGRRLLLELERSRADLASAQAISHLGSYAFDVRTNEVLASDELLRLLAIEPGEFQGTLDDVLRHLHPDDVPAVLDAIGTILAEHSVPTTRVRVPLPGGGVRWVEAQGAIEFDPDGEPARVLGTAQDVTERVLLEQEGKRLLARIVELREADRREIAREVEDGFLQTLSALLLRLEIVADQLADPGAAAELRRVSTAVRHSMDRLRRLVFDLHPTALDHGVGPAIEELASRMLAAWDLEVRVEDASGDVLPDEVRATVYRFLREALAALAPGTAAVRIVVEDDVLVELRHQGPGRLGEADRPLVEEVAQLAGGSLEIRADGETFLLLRLPNPASVSVET